MCKLQVYELIHNYKIYITITCKTKQCTKINLNKKYIGVCFGEYNLIIRKKTNQ